MIRVTIPISESSRDILAMYKKIRKLNNPTLKGRDSFLMFYFFHLAFDILH